MKLIRVPLNVAILDWHYTCQIRIPTKIRISLGVTLLTPVNPAGRETQYPIAIRCPTWIRSVRGEGLGLSLLTQPSYQAEKPNTPWPSVVRMAAVKQWHSNILAVRRARVSSVYHPWTMGLNYSYTFAVTAEHNISPFIFLCTLKTRSLIRPWISLCTR